MVTSMDEEITPACFFFPSLLVLMSTCSLPFPTSLPADFIVSLDSVYLAFCLGRNMLSTNLCNLCFFFFSWVQTAKIVVSRKLLMMDPD